MATLGFLSRRPWTSAALAGALVVLALLVVPFSYVRTTGQAVALRVSGAGLDAGRVRGIASQFKQALHAETIAVRADASDRGLTFTLSSTVPAGMGLNATLAANVLGAELKRLGYDASATVTPVRERVSGSVYAYARDQVIKVDIANKTPAQIEAEIRQGLANAGITNAQVLVTEDPAVGKEGLKLMLEAKQTSTTPGDRGQAMPQLVLEKGGVPIGSGNGFTVREEKRRAPDGSTLSLIVGDKGRTVTIDISNIETMSDGAITARVESQLRAAGIDAHVSTSGGRVMIQP